MILEKLRACWGFSPTVHRNVALVEGFLKGKSFADLAQEHDLSKSRVRQIIDKADRLVGGGILTKAESSKASPRSDFMVDYPYVWNLAERHRLGSVTPHHFFAELERAGSLERLVDKMKRLPGRTRTTTRELARLVWHRAIDPPMPQAPLHRSDVTVDCGKRFRETRSGSSHMIGDLLHRLDLHGDVEPVDDVGRRLRHCAG
ncbi:hypothetical protein [Mesorhizobium sp.]|uniref:hypothetical protein n=1 Tax=Mesorhizobium sp. TaxID=1871066 RepID=UPI00257E3EB5|nr:hypothetical protein [Mesorhizobium sp.]